MAHDVQTTPRGRTTPTRTIKPPVKALASKAGSKAPSKAKAAPAPKAKPVVTAAPAHDPIAVSVANLIRTLSGDQIYDLVAELFPNATEEFYEDVADTLVANVISARNEPTILFEQVKRELGLK